jgi:hypothetical protein
MYDNTPNLTRPIKKTYDWTGDVPKLVRNALVWAANIPSPPTYQYRFRLSPYVEVVYLNVTPTGWLFGYMNGGPTGHNPVLGKYESGRFYMIIDVFPDRTPGYYETMFLVGTVSTRIGKMIRTIDGLTYAPPIAVTLVPVVSEEQLGPSVTSAIDSQVTPQTWYKLRVSPYSDIVNLSDNATYPGWLNGYNQQYTPNSPILGCYENGRYFFGWDFIHANTYYQVAFVAGTVAGPPAPGQMIRTIDGSVLVGPEAITLVLAP